MKFLFLIGVFINFSLNKNLFAQAFPTYNLVLDQKNKSNLAKAINFTFSIASFGALGAFLTSKIRPLESYPLRNLENENNGIEMAWNTEEEEEIVEDFEEIAEEMADVDRTLKISLSSFGIIYIITFYYPAFKYIYKSFDYDYFISNFQGIEICRGTEKIFPFFSTIYNTFTSVVKWEELMQRCDNKLKYGETYFITLIDSSGKKVVQEKKIIPISN